MTEQEIKQGLLDLEPVVESEKVDEANERPLSYTYENETHILKVSITYLNAVSSREWMAQEFINETLTTK